MDSSYQGSYSRASPATVTRDVGWQRAARQARLLSWLSLAYMAAEGAIAIIAAVIAGSMALLGFGLDSAIEGLASVIIVWRFTGSCTLSETAEAWAQKAVAVTFFLLAPYIAYDAAATLITRSHAETSWLGIGLSIASLIVMLPWAWPNAASAPGSAPQRPPGRATRTCCAHTSPPGCWPGCWPTPS